MGMFDQPQAGGMMGGPNASSLMGMGGGAMMDPRMLQLLQLIQNHAAQQGQGMPGGQPPAMPGMGMAPQPGMPPGGMPQGMPPGGMQQGMQQGMMNPLVIARLRALMGQGQMGQGQMGGLTPQTTGGIPTSPMMGAPPAPGTFFGR